MKTIIIINDTLGDEKKMIYELLTQIKQVTEFEYNFNNGIFLKFDENTNINQISRIIDPTGFDYRISEFVNGGYIFELFTDN